MAKPGKYAHVISKLPRLLGEEPANRDKVNAVKDAIRAEPGFQLHASTLAKMYAEIREEKEAVEVTLSEVNVRLNAVSEMMIEQFEVEGVTTLKSASGRAISVSLQPYTQVVDKEACRLWAIAQGLEQQMTLPWMTLNGLAKKMLLEGEEPPAGTTIFAKTQIRLGSE